MALQFAECVRWCRSFVPEARHAGVAEQAPRKRRFNLPEV